MKKKLLIATDCFLPRWDGIARFLLDMIPSLKNDFDITVIAPDFKGDSSFFEELKDIPIIRLPLSRIHIADFIVAKADKKIIEKHVKNADVLWVHTISTIGRRTIDLGKQFNKKTVFLIHSLDHELVAKSLNLPIIIRDAWNVIGKKNILSYYEKCDVLLTPSRNVDDMLEWNAIKVPKIRVNLGVNLKKFHPPESKSAAKKAIGFKETDIVIGFCGRIAKEKRIETLFMAFDRIKGDFPQAKLLIVGKGNKDIVSLRKEQKDVFIAGNQDNVVPFLQAMDIFVLPSLVETTSLATLEAMACGVAIATTPIGYVKEYIKEKINGVFFPFENDTVLAVKLKWLIKENYVRESLGRAARLTVERNFNLILTKEKIKKVLEEL